MPLFRLITFDVKDTLLRMSGTVGQHYAKVAGTCGVYVQPQALDRVYPVVWKLMKKECPNYGVNQGMTSRDWWAEFVTRVFLSAGITPDKCLMSEISHKLNLHFKTKEGWIIYPNSHDILKWIKSKGIQLGVVSNFDKSLEVILKELDLDHYFDFVLTAVDVKHEKPNAEIFRVALKKGCVAANEAAHVGDSLEADYWGARNAGMTSFLLDRNSNFDQKSHKYKDVDRKYVLSQLSDLKQHIS